MLIISVWLIDRRLTLCRCKDKVWILWNNDQGTFVNTEKIALRVIILRRNMIFCPERCVNFRKKYAQIYVEKNDQCRKMTLFINLNSWLHLYERETLQRFIVQVVFDIFDYIPASSFNHNRNEIRILCSKFGLKLGLF